MHLARTKRWGSDEERKSEAQRTEINRLNKQVHYLSIHNVLGTELSCL